MFYKYIRCWSERFDHDIMFKASFSEPNARFAGNSDSYLDMSFLQPQDIIIQSTTIAVLEKGIEHR